MFEYKFSYGSIRAITNPSKLDRKVAIQSYSTLTTVLEKIHSEQTEIKIEESKNKIRIPLSALKVLAEVLKAMGEGKMISIVPIAAEVTTQAAAEILGCSRPYVVKLLEEGRIPFVKVGKHRRLKFEDMMKFKQSIKKQQKQHLIDIMNSDEAAGLYDS